MITVLYNYQNSDTTIAGATKLCMEMVPKNQTIVSHAIVINGGLAVCSIITEKKVELYDFFLEQLDTRPFQSDDSKTVMDAMHKLSQLCLSHGATETELDSWWRENMPY